MTNDDPMRPFTREMARKMTDTEVTEFWRERQRARRAAGCDHYATLVMTDTGEVVAAID